MDGPDPSIYALALLVINGGALWIREIRKGKKDSTNGDDLKDIKDTISTCEGQLTTIDGKVGETNIQLAKVKTAVDGQKTQCAATVTRFDKAIGDQNKELISLAKEQGRKH